MANPDLIVRDHKTRARERQAHDANKCTKNLGKISFLKLLRPSTNVPKLKKSMEILQRNCCFSAIGLCPVIVKRAFFCT